jgi:DNA-binding MarR family transcriptional regulator
MIVQAEGWRWAEVVDMQDRQQLSRDLGALLRRLTVESDRLAHSFASRHGLHPTDLQALIHIMDAAGQGQPLTAGGLRSALGMSSGATTAVIDRLETTGHIRRDRAGSDRRSVHLHYADHGMALALDFFGPLGVASERIMADFTDLELATVKRYLTAMSDTIQNHRNSIDSAKS